VRTAAAPTNPHFSDASPKTAPRPRLDERAMDRAAGVLLGAAAGDALGVPYEFRARLREDQVPQMLGGGLGNYEPGEFSDDTQMQAAIAAVSATGADMRTEAALDAVAQNFLSWLASGPADIGSQTRQVLSAAKRASATQAPARAMLAASREFTRTRSHSAGNGSLMRTGIVALSHLDDPTAMAQAATLVSELTHADPDCADACVLWCSGVRRAVLDGTFDGVREGLALLPADRRQLWTQRLDEAEANPPHHFERSNGWVVSALQAAWSAIVHTPVPDLDPARGTFPAQHFQLAAEAAVRAGNDTDTVAAIAGALLGARWGCSAIPLAWQQAVHGWPGLQGHDLVSLAVRTARGGTDDADGWPSQPRTRTPLSSGRPFSAAHPYDKGIILGNQALTEDHRPGPVDAVVSLCRVGTGPILAANDTEHIRVWLVDKTGANSNLHYALDQAATEVLRLRAEGKTVLVHCVAGASRTPAVAALCAVRSEGVTARTALRSVRSVLGSWRLADHRELHDAVYELAGQKPVHFVPASWRRPKWLERLARR